MIMGLFDKLAGKNPENRFIQQVQAIAQEIMDLYSTKVNAPFEFDISTVKSFQFQSV
jgi:hypothetical protein